MLISRAFVKLFKLLVCQPFLPVFMLGVLGLRLFHPFVDDTIFRAPKIYLHFRRRRTLIKIHFSGTGVMQFHTVTQVSMVPCGESSQRKMQKNYENWTIARAKNSKYFCFRFRKVMTKSAGAVFYMERLTALETPLTLNEIAFIQNDFFEKQSRNIDYFKDIASLNKKIKYASGIDFDSRSVLAAFNFESRFGMIHGDLTVFNIMKNKRDELALIDLDRFELSAPLYIDSLHYEIYNLELAQRKTWMEILLALLISNTRSRGELLSYFLFRTFHEVDTTVGLNSKYKNEMQKLATYIQFESSDSSQRSK